MPKDLHGKGVSVKAVLEWARGELNGVEPDLTRDLIQRIQSGEVTEVVLRPKRPGFFGPDGKFIDAFEYPLDFGGDLDEAEEHWEKEEEDNAWVDEENNRFNKKVVETCPRIGQALWEHGKRIETYAQDRQRSVSRLLHLLDRRKGPDGYARHTHQTCLDFYRWRPNLQASDALLDWRWERIDAVLRFSSDNRVRDHLNTLLETSELGAMRDDLLARLLGIKTREPDLLLKPDELLVLEEVRDTIRGLRVLEAPQVHNSVAIVARIGSAKSDEHATDADGSATS